MQTWKPILLPVLTVLAAVAAHAQDPGGPTTQPYDDLSRRLEAVEAKLSSTGASESPSVSAGSYDDEDTPCDCRPTPEDTYPTVKVNGFFHLDAGFYSQDAASTATLGDIDDGLGFRRSRLSASGQVTESTSYMMEYDFAQSQARFTDVWMQFAETPLGTLRFGRYRQPFGMAELTSIKELPFLERPSLFALAPFRQTGAMLSNSTCDENFTWAVSGYRYLSDNFGNVYADAGGYGLATRLTAVPLAFDDEHLLHVGFDYSFNDPGRDLVRYLSTDELLFSQSIGGLSVVPSIGVPAFVDTGQIPTANSNLFNLEGALGLGSMAIQSELRWAMLEQQSGVKDTFPGAYLHVRYVLTGENIPYNRKGGVFGRVVPKRPVNIACGDWGAWELGARVSYIDLNGTALPGPGRRLTDTILGVSWYVNGHTKFQLNYIHSDLNDLTIGDSNTDTVAIRGQLDF